MFEDDGGAIQLANNPLSRSGRKHIVVCHPTLRGLVCGGEIQLEHLRSEQQHADMMTKALRRHSL